MAYLGRPGATAPLTSADIPDDSITAAKIVDGTIAVGDIGTNAVGADELANDAVDTNAIADDAVTGAKIENNPTIAGNLTVSGDLVPSTPLSNRNMIINGKMQVWQRSEDTTASDGSNEGYNSVDRWDFQFNSATAGAIQCFKSTDSPDEFADGSLRIKCTSTGTPASSTTDYISIETKLEGRDLQHLRYGTAHAKTMTFSWYMKSVAFVEPIAIFLTTPNGTDEYFTVNKTPTTSWARYSFTIPGSTSATIDDNNVSGLIIGFIISAAQNGTMAQANDSTAWSTSAKKHQDDQGNFVDDTNNYIYITGVQLELGSSATPFEHRSYGDELARCQRYYYTGQTKNYGYLSSTSNNYRHISINHPVSMRAGPTIFDITWSGGTNIDYQFSTPDYADIYVSPGNTTDSVTLNSFNAKAEL